MSVSWLSYKFHYRAMRQAWRHLRARVSSYWAVLIVISMALTIHGIFSLLLTNAEAMLVNWQGDNRMIVFVKRDISPQQITHLRDRLARQPQIDAKTIVTVDPDMAMSRLKGMVGSEAALLNDLDGSPLPYTFEFRLTRELSTELNTLAHDMATWPNVDGVTHDRQWAQRLDAILHVFRQAGLVLTVILLSVVGLIIANTIKLTIIARQDEINVMLLMGATRSFIRAPFIYEGVIQGVTGALLAIILTTLLYFGALQEAVRLETAFGLTLPIHFLPLSKLLLLLTMGTLLGLVGALFSLSRFLKMEFSR
ncbi:MAG: FtsX-like permease family protein [Magnetococcales bacterium]|nr:FtsX-like permease family protein [Magnetococcales bacterium]